MRSALWCVALCACLEPELELPPAVELVGVSPALDVPEEAPVTVAFSGAIHRAGRWPIEVLRDGEEIAAEISASETTVLIAPSPRWPPGAKLEIAIHDGIEDELGRPIRGGTLHFTVRARDAAALPAIVRTPTPGTRAPLNLKWVAIALGEEEVEHASLDAEAQHVDLEPDGAMEGVVLFRLPAFEGECRPLCPGAPYRIAVDGWTSGEGPLGTVETGTIADERAPEIVAVKVVFRGGQPWVEICADEPVLVRGEARSSDGSLVPYRAMPVAEQRVLAKPAVPLDSATPHDLVFQVEDLAGNRAPEISVPLVTPPAIAIAISEIVASPLRDWGDSEGGAVPFDPIPGVGSVSEADEWIELVNLSDAPLDLESAGIELATIDGTPSVTPLAGAPALYFGDGGSIGSWWPGEALVVRPRGAMSSSSLIVEVKAGEQLLDRVVLGEQSGADHAGGSPPDVTFESIARAESGGFLWCVPTPGDPLPARQCDQ